MTKKCWPALALTAALLVLVGGCSGTSEPTAEPTETPIPTTPPTNTPVPQEPVTVTAHRFVDVGDSIDVSGLGEILEVSPFAGVTLVHDSEAETVTCNAGGTGLVRARYRAEGVDKNQVQTMAVVCIDETGDCDGQTTVTANFEQFLEDGPGGEANYLANGSGALYGVCVVDGKYRLQRAPDMPPLMLRLIDALGDGPYSIGSDDIDLLEGASFVSYSGEEYSPAKIAMVGPEARGLEIDPGGGVFMVDVTCNSDPGCINDPDLVNAGDMLVINFGADLERAFNAVPFEVLRQFVGAHIDFDWSRAEQWSDPEAGKTIVYRLVGLQVMDNLLGQFDRMYDLRDSGVMIGYAPYWATRGRVTNRCFPEGEEQEQCEEAEAALDAYERERVAQWRAQGYDLWHFDFLGYQPDGTPKSISSVAPSFDAFAGVGVSVETGAPLDSGDRADVLERSIRAMAEEVGDQPVIISANWGPMEFVVEGTPCEAEICPSAFSRYYEVHEPLIAAMLEVFDPGQVRGFGVALFDGGMHFDIREPYESYGFGINRVGETGFNSPLMNLYLAR